MRYRDTTIHKQPEAVRGRRYRDTEIYIRERIKDVAGKRGYDNKIKTYCRYRG